MRLSRSRSFSPLCLFSLVALFLSTASAAVLGIDLGTEYIKAVLVKPGRGLEIVLTKDSRRKEAAAIAFKPVKQKSSFGKNILPERHYGADAVAISARFPGDTFQNIKTLLGVPFTDETVASYRTRYPGAKLIEEEDQHTVALRSSTFEENERPFLVEELLAMELQNVVANAAQLAQGKVKDVVLTVPSYWTVVEKDALLRSAELAGLNVLALVTDGLAVGLHYAMDKEFPVINQPGKANKPEYHIIYDMGAGGTTATVLRMQGRVVKDVGKFNKTVQEVQVAGVGWDQTLGGDALNTVVLEDMLSKLAEQIKSSGFTREQIAQDGRTVSKLWKESERLRQVLSANAETQASFEGLFQDDISFKYKLKRTDFEAMTQDFKARVNGPVDQAMHSARVEFSDIDSIIVHGGAQRTPFVQRELEKAISSATKVRNNVNSDEAAAHGAALLAASHSSTVRVRDIRPSEAGVHDVWVSWNQDGKEKKQKIFTDTSAAGLVKQIPFKTPGDEFDIQIFQQVLDGDNMRNIPVWNVKTTNLTKALGVLTDKHGCSVGDIKTHFEMWLDPSLNIPDVIRGAASCEVDDKKGSIVDGIKGFFGGKKDDQEVLKDDVPEESSSTKSQTTASSDASSPSEAPKKKTQTVYIGVLTDSAPRKPVPQTEIIRLTDRLVAFKQSDTDREQRAEALNQLEGYSYRVRDLLESETFVAVSTEAQRKEIAEKASAAAEWLYGDGAEAIKSEFDTRLKELKSLVTPIESRREEAAGREQQIELLEKALDSTKSLLDTLKASAENSAKEALSAASDAASTVASAASSVVNGDDFADLEEESSSTSSTAGTLPTPIFKVEDFTAPYEKLEKAREWLTEKLAAQSKLLPSDDPAVLIADIKAKTSELTRITSDLLQKQMRAAQGGGKSKTKSSKGKSKTPKVKKVTMTGSETTKVGHSDTSTADSSSTTHDEL